MSDLDPTALVQPAATRVRDPISGRSVWLAGMVQNVRMKGEDLVMDLHFVADHSVSERQSIQAAVETNLRGLGFAGRVYVMPAGAPPRMTGSTPAAPPSPPTSAAPPAAAKKPDPVKGMSGPGMGAHGGPVQKMPVPGVAHVIAVASGKGGVGKSTVATNLAVALARSGWSVGLLDADIYGPSVPTMMGVHERPMADSTTRKILPVPAHGVRCISMGMLVDAEEAMIWRGPMVMGAVRQFLQDADWSGCDVLVVDLPPGTGDAQLTLIQAVDLAGAVIVTTPQPVALADAVRAITMFRKLEVPLLGLVENMAYYELPDGSRDHVFGKDGGKNTAEHYETELLGQLPLRSALREAGDASRGRGVRGHRPPGARQAGRGAIVSLLAPSAEAGAPAPRDGSLVDRFARVHTYLRVSVTDRCNYRCTYCMPADGLDWMPRAELLTFEEITRIVTCLAAMGVWKVRLTGGEPTVRRGLSDLVARIAAVPGIRDLAMTTNAHRLASLAPALAAAGLRRVNVSIDALDPSVFSAITRGGDVARVLQGIDAALAAGLRPVKLNCVVVRGVNDEQPLKLIEHFADRPDVAVRFIEYMPFDGVDVRKKHLPAKEIRDALAERYTLEPLERPVGGGPAVEWRLAETGQVVGFVSPITEHFCDACNRLRLQADGHLRTCLSREAAPSLRDVLRAGVDDTELAAILRERVWGKVAGHQAHLVGGEYLPFEGVMTAVGG
jgi:GTP 3',8-cyclase